MSYVDYERLKAIWERDSGWGMGQEGRHEERVKGTGCSTSMVDSARAASSPSRREGLETPESRSTEQ